MAAEHDLSAVTSDSTLARASDIPSLDRLLNEAVFTSLLTKYARSQVTGALRGELERKLDGFGVEVGAIHVDDGLNQCVDIDHFEIQGELAAASLRQIYGIADCRR